jgi:hypothetical protein
MRKTSRQRSWGGRIEKVHDFLSDQKQLAELKKQQGA